MNGTLASQRHKVLAINFGGIGDEVLFEPTLRTIKEERPNWHLTLMLEPRSQSIQQLTDLLDAVVTFDIKKRPLFVSDLLDLLGMLRAGNYQTVISSGSSPLVSMLLFLSGIPERIGYDSGRLSRFLLTRAIKLNYQQYAASMYHDLISGLDPTSYTSEAPPIPLIMAPDLSIQKMQQLLVQEENNNPGPISRIVIHPGTSQLALKKGIVKTWSGQSWINLIARLLDNTDLSVVLAGGPDDAKVFTEIKDGLSKMDLAPRVVMAYGKTQNLADLAALITLADLLVCVDSAPMHIAVGLNKPLVALFGPTDHNKLLPKDAKFKALSIKQKHARRPTKLELSSGVQLPPDIVYQAVMDQLQLSLSLRHSQ